MTAAPVCSDTESNRLVRTDPDWLAVDRNPPGLTLQAHNFAVKIVHHTDPQAAVPKFSSSRRPGAEVAPKQTACRGCLVDLAVSGSPMNRLPQCGQNRIEHFRNHMSLTAALSKASSHADVRCVRRVQGADH
jgi:hypothetical protein